MRTINPAAQADAHLRDVEDALEFAARVPGQVVTFDRKDIDACLNDIRVARRTLRNLSEGA